MKRLFILFVSLFLLAACSTVSISHAEGEPWQIAYFELLKERGGTLEAERANGDPVSTPPYAFVDFNQDGVPELVRNVFRIPNEFAPMEIYTYADGELREFGREFGIYIYDFIEVLPDGYRNKQTSELIWISRTTNMSQPDNGWNVEIRFDFDACQMNFAQLPFQTYRYDVDALRWFVGGETVSQEQYEKALQEWQDAHELVIPHDSSFYTEPYGPDSYSYPSYEAMWQAMLEVSNIK